MFRASIRTGTAIIGVIVATLLFIPAAASAASCTISPTVVTTCPPVVTTRTVSIHATDEPWYRGWASIESNQGFGVACAYSNLGLVDPNCVPSSGMTPVSAWQWTTRGWAHTTIAHGTRVYHWPFGSGWSWVWTSTRGWLAVRSDAVLIRTEIRSCIVGGVNTCPQPL